MFHETDESKIDINKAIVLSGLDSSLWKKTWWYKVNILQAIWICPKHNLPKHHITFHFHMQQYWIASHVRCEAKSRRQGRRTTKPRFRIGDRILSSVKLQLGWNFKQHLSLGGVISRTYDELLWDNFPNFRLLNIHALNSKSFYPKSWEKFCLCVLLPFTKKGLRQLRSHVGGQDQLLHSLKGKCKKKGTPLLRLTNIRRSRCYARR